MPGWTCASSTSSLLNTHNAIRFVAKPLVFVTCLAPAALTTAAAFGIGASLGANPIEAMLDSFGNWGLRFVMIALAVTPLRRLTGWSWLARFRRMLGLFAFVYVLMHFLTWLLLDLGLIWSGIGETWPLVAEDLVERPFITVGFAALLLLTALAATSFAALRRRMGRNWNRLHRAVYVVGILGVVHYWWQVKADWLEPAIYAAVLAVLLIARLHVMAKRRTAQRKKPGSLSRALSS